MRKSEGPVVHVGLPGQEGLSLLKEALDGIAGDAVDRDGKSDVLILGRYHHLKLRNMGRPARQYPRPRFSYMTVHRSKGLDADHVVALGLRAGKHGFPAGIADDPLLDLVLAVPWAYPNAGERRLLYDAITRARHLVHLLADRGPPSAFARELIEDGYDVAVFDRLPEDDVPCTKCKGGRPERRENPRGKRVFHGCSNWPYRAHTARPCPNCGTGLPVGTGDAHTCRDCRHTLESCPACDGWLETRMGRHGRFLGCSNWPDCGYTRDLGRSGERSARRRRRPP